MSPVPKNPRIVCFPVREAMAGRSCAPQRRKLHWSPARTLRSCAEQLARSCSELARVMVRTPGLSPSIRRKPFFQPVTAEVSTRLHNCPRLQNARCSRCSKHTLATQLPLDQISPPTRKVEVRGTCWPTSRCLGFLRSTDARKLLSAVRMFRGRSTEFELSVYWRKLRCKGVHTTKVRAERLLQKLRCRGVHPAFVDLAGSWLQQRSDQMVVEGQRSDKMLFRNMVFQGTVLGPTL